MATSDSDNRLSVDERYEPNTMRGMAYGCAFELFMVGLLIVALAVCGAFNFPYN